MFWMSWPQCLALYAGLRQQPNGSRPRATEAPPATDARPENRSVSQNHHRRTRLHQNIRRGHYELGVDEPVTPRVVAAFDELAQACCVVRSRGQARSFILVGWSDR